MSSKLIAIVGPSGTGKSTSIQFLNPKETYLINVARKELPFRGAERLYNVENKNYSEIDDIGKITELLLSISKNAPWIKKIVLDDAIYSMSFLMMKKAQEVGFTKFVTLAQIVTNMLTTARRLRSDLTVFYVTHSESIEDGDKIVGQKMKTIGKALDSQIVLEGLFTIVLYTHVDYDENGLPSYHFVTNRYKNYSAKSPQDMFPDILIDNNLGNVCKAVEEYYAEPLDVIAKTEGLAATAANPAAPALTQKVAASVQQAPIQNVPEPVIIEDLPKTEPKAKTVKKTVEVANPETKDAAAMNLPVPEVKKDSELEFTMSDPFALQTKPLADVAKEIVSNPPEAALPSFLNGSLDGAEENQSTQFAPDSEAHEDDGDVIAQLSPEAF